MAVRHGGNLRLLARQAGLDEDAILDFSASINPLGPPEGLRPALARAIDRLVHYPDPDAAEVVRLLAEHCRAPGEEIVVGNGSTEIFFALARACPFDRAVMPVPSYSDYAAAVEAAGRPVVYLKTDEQAGFALDWSRLEDELRGGDLVFLGQPNNPTGRMLDTDKLLAVAGRHLQTTFVVDEAFADFVAGPCSAGVSAARAIAGGTPAPQGAAGLENLVVVRSLTKFYAIPGLRLGFAIASPAVAEAIRRQIPTWSVNSLAQAAVATLLADEDYVRRTVGLVTVERQWLVEQLATMPGLFVYPGAANYLLVRIDRAEVTAWTLAERLLAEGIAIRTFAASQHLDQRFFRIAVRTREENQRLIEALAYLQKPADCIGGMVEHIAACVPPPAPPTQSGDFSPIDNAICHQSSSPRRTKTPALMLQGTSSNAGKSVLTAALCRILLQDGVRVAPFKSQNMSLNSFVTRDGGEMGRAQVVQAQACRIEPDVCMNPVLLKPCSDTGCQVIVRGRPVGNMRVGEYVAYKPQAFAAACQCYDALAAEFDAIVLEGAGSPGEVNLKSHDIVNMRMAQYASAPVLVVGDIDRGGVFASFVGTMEVLAPWERKLVAGWIVNRFRGDASLLGPAHEYTLAHTGRPVLGVVPYLPALNLPQEDSVEFKSGALDWPGSADAVVEIAVIDLPHISNFTDFDALRAEADVRLRIIRSASELDSPDAVVIPGSKNTLGDLEYLCRSGLAERIRALAAQGTTEIVGICGGLQILGREIRDPLGIESSDGRARGLGLLEVDTVLAAEKTLVRTSAVHGPSGLPVVGYEIHHGQTAIDAASVVLTRSDGQAVGAGNPGGPIWGTYLHGVFDADAFRRWFIDHLRIRRGLPPVGRVVAPYDIESALDRLADVVRRSVRMEDIYRLMRLQ